MGRKRTAVALAAAAALTLPAAGHAAKPRAGEWVNSSQTNGAEFTTRGNAINDLRLYCRHTSFELFNPVHVRSDGSFSFKGKARQWGHEHQWWGDHTVRVSGRFVSSSRVRITRSTPTCKRATITVRRTG